MKRLSAFILSALLTVSCNDKSTVRETAAAGSVRLHADFLDEAQHTISICRAGRREPLITQHVKPDFRPFMHPIVVPDGKGVLTEYSPGHHKHQSGLYRGFVRVNGRDYFHNPGGEYWQRVSAEVKQESEYDLSEASCG